MPRKALRLRIAFVIAVSILVLALVPSAPAAPAGGGHGSGKACTQRAPAVAADNTWAWAASGSWGRPGQQLTYAIHLMNNDVGCAASTFSVGIAAATGFSVSIPTNTISLKSSSQAYLSAYVTSPRAVGDGDYPLTITITRTATATQADPFTSYYKVYSSDTAPPKLYLPNPWDGDAISGDPYHVTVSSSDDHAVRKIDLYIDGVYKTTKNCENISYECQLYYNWSLRGVQGAHTATFTSYDWLDNSSVLIVTFTVA